MIKFIFHLGTYGLTAFYVAYGHYGTATLQFMCTIPLSIELGIEFFRMNK